MCPSLCSFGTEYQHHLRPFEGAALEIEAFKM